MADRVILHSDMNCFYANVECFHRPEIREQPVVVGGNEQSRHGIVLAKNQIAKRFNIKTGETLWQARQKCPEVVVVPPDYQLYMKFSRMARGIYYDYTNQVEPFGPDECWLDVTGSMNLWCHDPMIIAQEISERIKAELGITVSVGVSWNKIFAKFGSDYKKPDAITVISRENYRAIVWDAPVEDLLYVGHATKRKLNAAAIFTIGELACAPRGMLVGRLGKMGAVLQDFALGLDATPVKVLDPHKSRVEYVVKSVGNGLTAPHDIVTEQDAKALVYLLSESVAQRLREQHFKAQTVSISARRGDNDLTGYVRQAPLPAPSCITREIADLAFELLAASTPFGERFPLRALAVRATKLVADYEPIQLDLFLNEEKRLKREHLDFTIDEVRKRFGNTSLQRVVSMQDESLRNTDIKRDNIVHPVGFFAR